MSQLSSLLAAPATPLARSASPPTPRWFLWTGLVALIGYALFLSVHMTTVAGGADSSGYMNSAQLFARGEVRTALRVPAEFADIPLKRVHFIPAGLDVFPHHPDLAPTYPTGFPLHLALGARLLGWNVGPFAVQLLGALAALWLLYLSARELGIHYSLAAAGAAILAAFPVFIFTSFQTLSDTPATTWALATLFFALRSRAAPGWAIACGAALGIAVLVRPTNLLLAPALVVLLGLDLRRLGRFVLGGIPCALWLFLYNHHLYGGALTSGYRNISVDLGPQFFLPTLEHFAKWLALFLPAVVLALPFAALAHRDTRRRELLGLGCMAAGIIGFYLCCAFSSDSWPYLRYIQPALPALILAALLGVEALARGWGARWPRAFRPAAALLLAAWAAGNSWYWSRTLALFYVPGYERAYDEASRLVRQHVPANALMVCCNVSGAVYFHTQMPTLLFDSVEPHEFAEYVARTRRAGRPVYAALFNIEEEEAFRRCPGAWQRIASAGNIGLWRLQ